MLSKTVVMSFRCGFALLCAACRTAGPPSATTAPTPAASAAAPSPQPRPAEPAPSPTARETQPPSTEAAPAAAPPSEPEPEPAPGPSRAPNAILAAPNAAFVLDYNRSAPKVAAEKACSSEAGEDATKRQDCLQKARASFVADVLRFKKDGRGKWWWTIYQRKGSSLAEVYKAEIQLSDETKNSIKIRIKGSQSGALPIFTQTRQGLISFPNDYSITLDDPKHGSLAYDAKVGAVGD